MARQVSRFMIGFFVTFGLLIGAATIIWVGASRYFEKGVQYVTYFDESVQGLQKDSTVKYRGVDVGRVEKIGVAPDNKLIEVVMKIALEDTLEKNTVAKLKTIGITGIVFVELDRREPDISYHPPAIQFPTEYPIIPSQPSDIRRLFSEVDDVIEKLKSMDIHGIVEQVKSTAKTAEDFLAGAQMKTILTNLGSSSAHLDGVMARLDKMTAEGKLDRTLVEARQTLADARSLISAIQEEMQSMKRAGVAGKANQVLENMTRITHTSAVEIQATTENLRRASESLERLLERLETNPSDLIFSKPQGERKNH